MIRLTAKVMYPAGTRGKLPVLFYHRVLPRFDPLTPEVLWAERFEAQVRAISRNFRVLPLDEAADLMAAKQLPDRAISITFDDGYADNLTVAVPILQRHNAHATFFLTSGHTDGGLMYNDVVTEVVRRLPAQCPNIKLASLGGQEFDASGSRAELVVTLTVAIKYLDPLVRQQACDELASLISEKLPDHMMMTCTEVTALAKAGMGIGGHTVSHPILSCLSPEAARKEISENRRTLAELTGQPVRVFAYPNGKPGTDYTDVHVDMVREAGYDYAVSTHCGVATPASEKLQLPRVSPWHPAPLRFQLDLIKAARWKS